MQNRLAISVVSEADTKLTQTKVFHVTRCIPLKLLTQKCKEREDTGFKLESHTSQRPNCKIQHVRRPCEENSLSPELKSKYNTAALFLIIYILRV